MKHGFGRIVCFLCSLIILAVNISAFAADAAPADQPNAGLAAVYGYVLNDYINLFGVVSDEHPKGFMGPDADMPNGVVYADIINFDNNDYPYLVIFVSDAERGRASCHIWSYNCELDRSEKVGEIAKEYAPLTRTRGAFALGWNGDKRYITYSEFDASETYAKQYFTVIDGDAFQYVESPGAVNEAAVMNFTDSTFYSDVNISDYNAALSDFFSKLKDTSAASVTYPEISDVLTDEDMGALETEASIAAQMGNFDILAYSTMDEYEEALATQRTGATFYSVSSVHDLGDEMYYVRFATDSSYYNYALLRHTDRREKYQILKVRMDCIPLSDRELTSLKKEYLKSNLLYKKASASYAAPVRAQEEPLIKLPKPLSMPRVFDKDIRKPVVYVGAALTVLLIAGLLIFIFSDKNNE